MDRHAHQYEPQSGFGHAVGTERLYAFFNYQGTPLKLPGIGDFPPGVNRHGERKINIRVDRSLKRGIDDDE
jgi:hypothetical protein